MAERIVCEIESETQPKMGKNSTMEHYLEDLYW